MRAVLLVPLLAIGCADVFGIDETTGRDAGGDAVTDGPRDAAIDAPPCTGGDARASDPVSGTCYVLFMTPQARDGARATCLTLGQGTLLASVQSNAENELITTLIGPATKAFLGGNDEALEGTFQWEDGTALGLANWNLGEPNNGAGMIEEDCIVISGPDAGKWDDRPCVANIMVPGEYPFVCERP